MRSIEEGTDVRGLAFAIIFSRLPRYPIHDEPLPSQWERLLQADREERWSLVVLVVVPVILILVVFYMHLLLYGIGVGLGGLTGD